MEKNTSKKTVTKKKKHHDPSMKNFLKSGITQLSEDKTVDEVSSYFKELERILKSCKVIVDININRYYDGGLNVETNNITILTEILELLFNKNSMMSLKELEHHLMTNSKDKLVIESVLMIDARKEAEIDDFFSEGISEIGICLHCGSDKLLTMKNIKVDDSIVTKNQYKCSKCKSTFIELFVVEKED
jgi:hypothetical protein